MKCIFSVTVIILCLINCTSLKKHLGEYTLTGPVIVSVRVGGIIDAEEREYFRLFVPESLTTYDAYEYRTATIWSIDDVGYKLAMSFVKDTIVVVNRDPQGIEILRDYIDNYEEVQESREIFEEKWGIVDHDFFGLPITKQEIALTRKHMIATQKSPSVRLEPVMKGALAGCIVGGVVAYIVAVTHEPDYDLDDSGIEGAFACIETWGVVLAAFGIVASSTLAGGCIGSLVDMAVREKAAPEIDEKAACNFIKKYRLPIMQDDTQQEILWRGY